MSSVKIVGICNPLLDISAEVQDSFLDKYGLEPNNAILAEDKHLPLYKEMKDTYPVEYIAGGAGQNSIRVAQWLLEEPQSTAYFGAVGKDEFCEVMTTQATNDGVKVCYYNEGGLPTGTCGVLITKNGTARSLVANLSAANTYKVDHLKAPEQWAIVDQAKLFYITGFFFTVSPETIMTIAHHCLETKKTLCMNLSAPFLIQVPPFFAALKEAMPFVDVYFGNESEARALSAAMEWNTQDVVEIAIALARIPLQSGRPRTVILTQGADPTVVVVADPNRLWSVDTYPVIPCPAHDLLDTNGAGDAFVGGVLAAFAKGDDLKKAIATGNYAANVVIKRPGATFPPKPDFQYKNTSLPI